MLQKEHFPAFEELHGDNQSKIFGNKLSEKRKKKTNKFSIYILYTILRRMFFLLLKHFHIDLSAC